MTRSFGVRIVSFVFVILLLNLAFMPVVSAQGFAESAGDNSAGFDDGIALPSSQVTTSEATGIPGTNNNSSDPPEVFPVIAAIAVIEIPTWVATLLGVATIVGIVAYADNSFALFNDNNYLKIADASATAAINGIFKTLGLLSPKSYKEAYSQKEGGAKWGNEADVYKKPLPCDKGPAEKSVDYRAKSNGNLVTRIYYNAKGWREITWDYDGHIHQGKIIHAHRWFLQFDKKGDCIPDNIDKRRPEVTFNDDGTETLEYEVPDGSGMTRNTL